jgi:hypothetical protein
MYLICGNGMQEPMDYLEMSCLLIPFSQSNE